MSTDDTFELTESVASTLALTWEQATALRAIGRRLAERNQRSDDSDRTLIECSSSDGANWRVRVVNAVGVVGLPGGVRVTVRPKIPMDHLIFLLRHGGAVPRTAPSPVNAAMSTDLQDLIASWFLTALEALIRGGLRRAYVPQQGRMPVVRGRVDTWRTTIDIARGNLQLSCDFEELTEDTALNRVLAAAAQRISRSHLVPFDVRRRARAAGHSMAGVGRMRSSDLQVVPDRIAARYVDAISLARLVLADAGTDLEGGQLRGSSFLLPTPLLVEAALRRHVAESLAPLVSVYKGRMSLGGSKLTVNPDLDFGRLAIGDVKYKVWDGSWIRADLYQLVAFAVAYERKTALHVGFGGPTSERPLRVGQTNLWRISWNSDTGVTPDEASDAFRRQVRRWWQAVEKDWHSQDLTWPNLEPSVSDGVEVVGEATRGNDGMDTDAAGSLTAEVRGGDEASQVTSR